jgi:perosamine synthetase
MLLTDRDDLADLCRSYRDLCFQPSRRFVHERLGWNMQMSNLQAAVGLAQLERLADFVERKRRMGRRYSERLAPLSGLQLPQARTSHAENLYGVYGVVLGEDAPLDAAEAMRRLGERGIGTRPFFWSMHEQPVFLKRGLFLEESYPVAERLARRGFYVPSGLALTETQMNKVVQALHEVIR